MRPYLRKTVREGERKRDSAKLLTCFLKIDTKIFDVFFFNFNYALCH